MWTDEKLEKAARDYLESENEYWGYFAKRMKDFIAGCKYIINNTQKEY